MIKTEAQERKLNEDLFFQYLKGIHNNAEREEAILWDRYVHENKDDMTAVEMAYIKFARASEKTITIHRIIKAYCDQIRGGMTI